MAILSSRLNGRVRPTDRPSGLWDGRSTEILGKYVSIAHSSRVSIADGGGAFGVEPSNRPSVCLSPAVRRVFVSYVRVIVFPAEVLTIG